MCYCQKEEEKCKKRDASAATSVQGEERSGKRVPFNPATIPKEGVSTTTASSGVMTGTDVLRFLALTLPFLLCDLFMFLLSVVAMAPGSLRMAWYYWFASHRLTFPYANKSVRQRLDVYPALRCLTNSNSKEQAPTLLFLYGGAWLIGYKLFGCLLARTLTAAGITVVVADYRNYPIATVPQQVDDAEAALQWTLRHVDRYGGDSKNLVVAGESAGGHLILNVLLQRALGRRRESDSHHCNWKPTDLKGVIAMATPVHLKSLEMVLAKHKWERSFFEAIFGGQVEEHDPYSLLLSHNDRKTRTDPSNSHPPHNHDEDSLLQDKLPPIQLFHGTHDRTVPLDSVQLFWRELQRAGVQADLTVYHGWTHIEANVQAPMTGDFSFHRDVFTAIQTWTSSSREEEESHFLKFPSQDLLQPVCPRLLCELATILLPF